MNDDRVIEDLSELVGLEVVVSEKLDGENTTLYPDGLHARSIDGRHHASRDWVKAAHGRIAFTIPSGWRVCGENMYARHSIPYAALESYFYVFSIWTDEDLCLDWDTMDAWARDRGFPTPRVLYRGDFDEDVLRGLEVDVDTTEGWVVRPAAGFAFDAFATRVAKWVRAQHVQTDQHWMQQAVVPNGLR
jgi:hypothetical protein